MDLAGTPLVALLILSACAAGLPTRLEDAQTVLRRAEHGEAVLRQRCAAMESLEACQVAQAASQAVWVATVAVTACSNADVLGPPCDLRLLNASLDASTDATR
jgi:hypothetical protein